MNEETHEELCSLASEIVVSSVSKEVEMFLSNKHEDACDKYQKLMQIVFSEVMRLKSEDW